MTMADGVKETYCRTCDRFTPSPLMDERNENEEER
jgi:hypothetical protein